MDKEEFEIITKEDAAEKYSILPGTMRRIVRQKHLNGLESSILMFGNKVHFRTDRLREWVKENMKENR